MKTKKQQKVKVKAWALTWKDKEVRRAYGVLIKESILIFPFSGQEVEVEKNLWAYFPVKDNKGVEVDSLAVFHTRKEAEIAKENNNEWKVQKIEIHYTPITSKSKK